jgi:ribose 1,5-bisphosphokinase PhnN
VVEFASDDPIAARALEALYHAAPAAAATPSLRYVLQLTAPREPCGYLAVSPGQPLFGPVPLADAWAYLEWRVTEDVMGGAPPGTAFLHAAGAVVGERLVLIVGDSGAGKSTLVAHLLLRGHRIIGDDVVRFAAVDGTFSAVGRSVKLDANALADMPLVASRCAHATVGTLLAAGCYYVSPAAIRRSWEAGPARAWAVVLLDATLRRGRAGLARSSEGEAAVYVTQKVLAREGAARAERPEELTVRLLESLADVAAYRAVGSDPSAVATALEREAGR